MYSLDNYVIWSSVVGLGGTFLEFGVKAIDKNDSRLKTVCVVFAKTIQSAAFAFSLLAIGSLSKNPLTTIVIGSVGCVMLLTPMINEIVQQHGNDPLKQAFAVGDKMLSVTSKVINIAIVTAWVYIVLTLSR